MYDGIDGWMCPWESGCAAILGADKCQKRGAVAGSRGDLGLSSVHLAGHRTVLGAASAASMMGAPPTGRNVSPFHPNWEANISVFLFARVYQIHPVSKSSWQQLSRKPGIIQPHQFRDQTWKA